MAAGMLDMPNLMQASLSWCIVKNSLKIALVVGTLLNLINQGESLLHSDKIFLVPFPVELSGTVLRGKLQCGEERDWKKRNRWRATKIRRMKREANMTY